MNTCTFFTPELEQTLRDHSSKILNHPFQYWENKWFLAQYQDDFLENRFPDMGVRYINEEKGRGVFANAPIKQNTFICPYVGLIRPRAKHDNENAYIFDYPCKTVIDAKDSDHICRFLNHNDNPNLTAQWLVLDGLYQIFFYSIRPISNDEELTFNYGPNFWRNIKGAAP